MRSQSCADHCSVDVLDRGGHDPTLIEPSISCNEQGAETSLAARYDR
jgi:hypothetical protein